MSETLSFTGTCDAVSSLNSDNWSAYSACFQGTYGSSGSPRLGAMLFSSLRTSTTWSSKSISKITLKLTFGSAGRNREKNLYLYQGTKTSLSGTGSALKGTSIGTVTTNGTAYGATRTITFDSSTNSSAFTNLVSWLKNTSSTTLVLYTTEAYDSDYGYSENYLQITAATLNITFSGGGTVRYGINGSFKECEVYYGINGSFKRVTPYYGISGSFVEIG